MHKQTSRVGCVIHFLSSFFFGLPDPLWGPSRAQFGPSRPLWGPPSKNIFPFPFSFPHFFGSFWAPLGGPYGSQGPSRALLGALAGPTWPYDKILGYIPSLQACMLGFLLQHGKRPDPPWTSGSHDVGFDARKPWKPTSLWIDFQKCHAIWNPPEKTKKLRQTGTNYELPIFREQGDHLIPRRKGVAT
jgi:hypothetical protein